MTDLIIDTSTETCLIALAKENHILATHAFPHLNLLSKNLIPSIQQLLEKQEIPLSSLSSIAVGVGPGSYTGTRLGAAVAKGLAFGLNIPMKSFCSPMAFLPAHEGSFAFVIPARSGDFFVLKGNKATQTNAGLVSADRLLSEVESADYLIASQALPDSLKDKPLFHPSLNLATLAQFLATRPSCPPEEIELQYLHTPF